MQATLREVAIEIQSSRQTIERERSLLKATVEAMPIGVIVVGQENHNVLLANQKFSELWGQPDVKGLEDLARARRLHLDGRPYDLKNWPIIRALTVGEIVKDEEVIHVTPDGSQRRIVINAAPVTSPAGSVIAAVAAVYDVTELREALHRQKLLLDEVNHRVKNTMASIQSIVRLSRHTSQTAEEFAAAFESRLIALSGAYDLLTYHHWEGADLNQLLDRTLAPYRGEDRIEVHGPKVYLNPKNALALTAAVQELATNAAKYGALSTGKGRVLATWEISGEQLDFRWSEREGPLVSPPARRGFGIRFIQEILASDEDWSVDMTFDPGGVSCCILTHLRANPATSRKSHTEERMPMR
jgi:PAS domain S-box-containing protein